MNMFDSPAFRACAIERLPPPAISAPWRGAAAEQIFALSPIACLKLLFVADYGCPERMRL
jgi:hypothetical protein